MAQRVLLGDDGNGNTVFRVSRPGFDVFTSTGSQLAFDSQFSNVAKVHMLITLPENQGSSTYVPFGKNFALPPPVIWMDKQNAYSSIAANEYEAEAGFQTIVDYRSEYIQSGLRVSVTNSAIYYTKQGYKPMSIIVLDVEQ